MVIKVGNNREAKQELHVFGHHVHDATGDDFCKTTHLTTLDCLPNVPLTVASPDFIRSVAVVVAIAASGKNAATAATSSALRLSGLSFY